MFSKIKSIGLIALSSFLLIPSVAKADDELPIGPGIGLEGSTYESPNIYHPQAGTSTPSVNSENTGSDTSSVGPGIDSNNVGPGIDSNNVGPGDTSTEDLTQGSVSSLPLDLSSIKASGEFNLPNNDSPMQDPIRSENLIITTYLKNSAYTDLDLCQNFGDTVAFSADGFSSLRLVNDNVGRLYYRTYSSATGWTNWAASNEATPAINRVEAVEIRSVGYIHRITNVYYRAVLNDGTLTDWAKEGESLGAMGTGQFITALKVCFHKNGTDFTGPRKKFLANDFNNNIYYDENGEVHFQKYDNTPYTGWAYNHDSNCYYFKDGNALKGWHGISGYNYYFDENGILLKDLEPIMGAQSSYKININAQTKTLYVMAKDSAGNYSIPFKTFMITSGLDTPTGNYNSTIKYRWKIMHKDCYCQFLTRFYKSFLMHSLLYDRMDSHSFNPYWYNNMDAAISAGCIRLKCEDAAWIYNNCKIGTPIHIYRDVWDKGPVQKDAIEIALPDNVNFDPTDPVLKEESNTLLTNLEAIIESYING